MDFLTTLETTEVQVLDHGYVKLVDFSPRIVPSGYTPEFRIVEAARMSTGRGLKTPEEDKRLIEYLYRHKHSSPFEMVDCTFELRLPKDIAVHFLRHRTGKFNQFSARYAEITNPEFYNPLLSGDGVRGPSGINKQGSTTTSENLTLLIGKANQKVVEQQQLYSELVNAGLATEIARFYLPSSEYTLLLMKFDLNNLIKLLHLRADSHAQLETQKYANAIITLCRPIFPTVFKLFDEDQQSITLRPDEIQALRDNKSSLGTGSRNAEYQAKYKRIFS